MEDLKEIRKRVSDLRKKVSGMPVSKASVDELKAEIAHHEAGMKAIMRKQLLAEKKKGIEVIAFPQSQKKTTLPAKSPAKPKKAKKVLTTETPSETEEEKPKEEPKKVEKPKAKMLVSLVKEDILPATSHPSHQSYKKEEKVTQPVEASATKKEEKPEKIWGKSRILGL